MDIGFIGVGNIGFPMARRLLKAGHHLVVCDLNSAAVDRMEAEGATVAGSPADVANAASLVMASLPTPQSVKAVVGGDKGLVNGKVIRCFVDLSTTGPTVAKEIAQLLENKGVVQIDAPVSGGVHGAEAGKLAVMASGPRQQFEFVEPILSNLGRVFFVGEAPGLGQAMKLVNNYLSAAALALTSEATVMGVKAGLDPAKMIEVLNAGSGCNSATVDKFPRSVLTGTFDYGFAAGLMYKTFLFSHRRPRSLGCPLGSEPWSGRCGSSPAVRWAQMPISLGSCSATNAGPASKCAHAAPATQEFQVSQPSWICAGPRLSKDIR